MTTPTHSQYHHGPHTVVRYPTYYVVIDLRTRDHDIVFETRSRDRAHKQCSTLNEIANEERAARQAAAAQAAQA